MFIIFTIQNTFYFHSTHIPAATNKKISLFTPYEGSGLVDIGTTTPWRFRGFGSFKGVFSAPVDVEVAPIWELNP